jgi:hypothetical protein
MGFIERIPSGSGDLHPTFLSIKASPYEQVMLLPWWEVPFNPTWTVVATPGPVSLPDPPIISPLDQEP